jgi:hypothetical protein
VFLLDGLKVWLKSEYMSLSKIRVKKVFMER